MKFKSGDVISVDFPGVKGIKRRPAVIVSSSVYHENRPDVIIGLITSQTKKLGRMGKSSFCVINYRKN